MTGQPAASSPMEHHVQALQERVGNVTRMVRPGMGKQELELPDLQVVVRTASRGILELLEGEGVQEARMLRERLELAAEADDSADLAFTVGGHYRMAEARRPLNEGITAQADHTRMALLAEAAGATAVAIVGSVLAPRNVQNLIRQGRASLNEYAGISRSVKPVRLMRGLLEEVERPSSRPKSRAAA